MLADIPSISSTLYARIFCTNFSPKQNATRHVTREKLPNKCLYEKFVRKNVDEIDTLKTKISANKVTLMFVTSHTLTSSSSRFWRHTEIVSRRNSFFHEENKLIQFKAECYYINYLCKTLPFFYGTYSTVFEMYVKNYVHQKTIILFDTKFVFGNVF